MAALVVTAVQSRISTLTTYSLTREEVSPFWTIFKCYVAAATSGRASCRMRKRVGGSSATIPSERFAWPSDF
jgi:hypothetical protein